MLEVFDQNSDAQNGRSCSRAVGGSWGFRRQLGNLLGSLDFGGLSDQGVASHQTHIGDRARPGLQPHAVDVGERDGDVNLLDPPRWVLRHVAVYTAQQVRLLVQPSCAFK